MVELVSQLTVLFGFEYDLAATSFLAPGWGGMMCSRVLHVEPGSL